MMLFVGFVFGFACCFLIARWSNNDTPDGFKNTFRWPEK